MKNFKIQFVILAFLAFAIGSCTDEEFVTLNSSATLAPTVSETDIILTEEQAGTDVLAISWPEPDYGFKASPTYIIYLDKGDDFSAPVVINNGGALSKTLSGDELNKHLLSLGLEPGVESVVKIKVESKLAAYSSLNSEVLSVNVTPYSAFLDLSTTWGVVGSAYNNWGAFPDAPFFTTKTANELVSYVTLSAGKIKFRENNDWANNFGDNGADGTLEAGGADIDVTAGDYKIIFNPVANTYSMSKFSWGIVGSAYNDWGALGPDAKFTYDDATDQWRVVVKLITGKFKIRKNNDWGLNYGDTGADGTLEAGGADIEIEGGKYLITFNENDLTIDIAPIDHIWGLVGSAYNDWGAAGPDAQFNMDWRNEGVWILKNVTLIDGKFKIRDSNDWGTNYGDSGADGTLDAGGSDIDVVAGIYTITIDFSNPASPTWTKVKH
jgi:starch-binding outer membrane protein SusE/F